MKYTNVFLLLFAPALLWGQYQFVHAKLENNSDTCIIVKNMSKIFQGAIQPGYILLEENITPQDTVAISLTLKNNFDSYTDLGIELQVEDSIYSYTIANQTILDNIGNVISIDTIINGDSILIGRTPNEILVLHNESIIKSIQLTTDSALIKAILTPISAQSAEVDFRFKPFSPKDSTCIFFLDTLIVVQEGDTAQFCIKKEGGRNHSKIDIVLQDTTHPHFTGYNTLSFNINPNDTLICFDIPLTIPNGIKDEHTDYYFELVKTQGNRTNICRNARIHVIVKDDVQDSIEALCPGDILIIGVDNDIQNGTDKIILTNTRPINQGTSFDLVNAIYENDLSDATKGKWYSAMKNRSGALASQKVTYNSNQVLAKGSVICLELPASGGSLLATNFEINGVSTNDFIVEANGLSPTNNINLTTQHPNALFVMQGEWTLLSDYAYFNGPVIHGIQIGADWQIIDPYTNPDFLSDLHPDISCLAVQRDSLEIATYYACESLSDKSVLQIQAEIVNESNWIHLPATTSFDLPSNICELNCIPSDQNDTLWYLPPKDLYFPCYYQSDYHIEIAAWLADQGGGRFFSSCGTLSLTNNYNGINTFCGNAGFTTVTFTATDSCGNSISTQASITIDDDIYPYWIVSPEDLEIKCDSLHIMEAHVQEWLDNLGGGILDSVCGNLHTFYNYNGIAQRCDTVIMVEFYAVSDCDRQSVDTGYIRIYDIDPPIFTTFPKNLILYCDSSYHIADTINNWIANHGEGEAKDNCSNVVWQDNLDQVFDINGYDCSVDTFFQVTFLINDDCGNMKPASIWVYIQKSSPICDTSLTIFQYRDTLFASRDSCDGVIDYSWYYRVSVDSLWSDITWANNDTLNPDSVGYYKVISTCDSICMDSTVFFWPVCDSLSLPVEDSIIGLKWGDLTYLGEPVDNYLIVWINREGDEVFRSASGIYYDSTTFKHPAISFYPVKGGVYVPKIIASDVGFELFCFDSLYIDTLKCGVEYSQSYIGSGSAEAHAKVEFFITDTTTLKVGFVNYTNPDQITLEYNNQLLDNPYSQSTLGFERVRVYDIPYVPGQNFITIYIDNVGSNQLITEWDLRVKCCNRDTCSPGLFDTLSFSALNPISQNACNINLTSDPNMNADYIWDHYCFDMDRVNQNSIISVSSCYETSNQVMGCGDDIGNLINIVELANNPQIVYEFSFPQNMFSYYQQLRTHIESLNSNQFVKIRLDNGYCGEDVPGSKFLNIYEGQCDFTQSGILKFTYTYPSAAPGSSCDYTANPNSQGSYKSIGLTQIRQSNYALSLTNAGQYLAGPDGVCIERDYYLEVADINCACESWSLVVDYNDGNIDTIYTYGTSCPQPLAEPELSTKDKYFKMYPNPTTNFLNVEFYQPHSESIKATIYDLQGNELLRLPLDTYRGINKFEIPLSMYPSGTYFLKLKVGDSLRRERLIIIK